MDAELLGRARIQDIEQEISRIRLAAVPAMPLRLLRRACRQTGTLRQSA